MVKQDHAIQSVFLRLGFLVRRPSTETINCTAIKINIFYNLKAGFALGSNRIAYRDIIAFPSLQRAAMSSILVTFSETEVNDTVHHELETKTSMTSFGLKFTINS